MKREEARNCRIACQYILDNLFKYDGKNINRMGGQSKGEIKKVYDRAQEISPAFNTVPNCLGRDNKTVNFDKVNDQLSRAGEWIEKWDKVDASITVGEYIETKKKYIALLDQYKETLKGEGLSMNDLSIMGLI